jgi:transcriptional regulator with XRE-family HTH domain
MTRRKWSEIRAAAAPETLAAASRKTEATRTVLELRELARERGFTQEALARRLDLAQGNVSRTLRRSDMHVSTLCEVVEAMGGELELLARFPDGTSYRLLHFEQGS